MHHSAHMNLLPQSSLQESLEHHPKIILNNFFLVLKSKLNCFYWYGNYLPHEISFGLFFCFFFFLLFLGLPQNLLVGPLYLDKT